MKNFRYLALSLILILSAFPVNPQNYVGLIGGVNIANIKTDTEE